MATVTISEIIAKAGTILHDPTHVRWPISELLDWVNDAAREIVLLRPEAFTKAVVFQLAADTLQTIPSDGIRVLDVPSNLTTTTITTPTSQTTTTPASMTDVGSEPISGGNGSASIVYLGGPTLDTGVFDNLAVTSDDRFLLFDTSSNTLNRFYKDGGFISNTNLGANVTLPVAIVFEDYIEFYGSVWVLSVDPSASTDATQKIHQYNYSQVSGGSTGYTGTTFDVGISPTNDPNLRPISMFYYNDYMYILYVGGDLYRIHINYNVSSAEYGQLQFVATLPGVNQEAAMSFDGTYIVVARGPALLSLFTIQGAPVADGTLTHNGYQQQLMHLVYDEYLELHWGIRFSYSPGLYPIRITGPVTTTQIVDVVTTVEGQGKAIRAVSRDVLDAQYPDWHYVNPYSDSQVRHVVYDGRIPKQFFVHPTQDGTTKCNLVYSAAPPQAGINDVIPIDDIYANAVLDYVLFRAYEKDADYSKNTPQASHFKEAFYSSLGVKQAADLSFSPNRNTTEGFPNSTGGVR